MSEEKAVEVKPSLLNFCRSMVEVNTHRVGSKIPDFGDKIEPEQRQACRAWLTAWISNDPGPYGKAIAYVQACLERGPLTWTEWQQTAGFGDAVV